MQLLKGNIHGLHKQLVTASKIRLKLETNEKMRMALKRIVRDLEPRHVHALAWIVARYPVAPGAAAMNEIIENYEAMCNAARLPDSEKPRNNSLVRCAAGPEKLISYFESAEYRAYSDQRNR
jgi:hypothetical protein